MAWTPPTMADEVEGIEPHTKVQCGGGCGYRVRADRMQRPPPGLDLPDYICDGCRGVLVAQGRVRDKADLVRHLGAPAKVIEKLEGTK